MNRPEDLSALAAFRAAWDGRVCLRTVQELLWCWCYTESPRINRVTNASFGFVSGIMVAFLVLGFPTGMMADGQGDGPTPVAASIVSMVPAKDTYLDSLLGLLNYGRSSSLIVDSSGVGLGNSRVLLQFDLSAIPAGATILDATLLLEVSAVNVPPVSLQVHRVTESWEEGGFLGLLGAANWNQRLDGTSWTSAGGSYDPVVLLTLAVSARGQLSLDLTSIVEEWVEGSEVNNGLLLGSPSSGSKAITFDSREGTTPPRLVVTYAEPPMIVSQPESQTVYAGANVAFTVTASGTSPLSYQWAFNEVAISGATNSILNLTNVSVSASGNYAVLVSNAGGSVTSLVAVLTVQAVPPSITGQPVSQTVVEGTNVTFTVTATGTAPLSYQWARNGSNIVGATNSTLSLTNVAMTASGDFTVLILNSGGFVASQAATLTVLPAPPGIITQPLSRTVSEGANVSLSVIATGTSPLSYQWKINAVPIAGATSALLSLTNVALSASGNYHVFITNSAGSITSQVAVLTVLAVPPSITSDPVNRTVNDGGDTSFNVTAAGTAPLAYQWIKDSSVLVNATNASLTLSNVALTSGGDYQVVVTNSAGSVTSRVARLRVLPVPPTIIAQPVSQNTTVGSSVTLSVMATGSPTLRYKWLRNNVTLTGEEASSLAFTNVQADDAGSYRVVVFNDEGSVTSADAHLTVTVAALAMTDDFSLEIGSTSFTGIGQSSNTVATLEVGEPRHAGRLGGRSMWFTWQAPDSGIVTFSTAGSDFDTLLAAYQGDSVNALVPLASDDDDAGFYNSQVQFNTESNAVYHIAVDGAGDASGSITLQWTLEPTADVLPVITQQPESLTVGQGSNAVFTVTAAGGGLEYQWYFNGSPITNATNSSWSISPAGLLDVGRYFVEVRLGSRTVSSDSAGLQITLAPEFEQDVLIADKFIDLVSSGRRLQLDPPPVSSFPFGEVGPSGPNRGYSGSQVFSTVGSLKEPGEPNHCGVPGGASQWFAFQAGTDGVLDMNTDGSTFDTVLAVYTGPGADFASLIPVACDNDGGTNGLTSSLHFITSSGTTYYIAVDGVDGASGTVVLNYTTLGEQQQPSITITSAPPVNVGLTNGSVTISGLASDNTELSGVEWRVTNSLGVAEWTLASGSNSWTFTADDLAFGNNTVQIRSLDSWGNESAITSRVYLRLAPVTVTVDGCGSVSSGFPGTTYREPGKSFSITATPCANSLFAGWSGDWVTNRNAITLVVQTGLVLQANFLTNEFARRVGNYAGLFYDTNVAAHESSGFVTARTTARGTYSGRLRVGTKNHSFSGSFGLDGLATNSVRRGGTNPPFRLELNFNLNQLVQSLAGRVIDTNWTADLSAFRAVFHSRTNPATYQGRYTLLFAANGAPGTPDGDGYGLVTVSPNGSVRLSGALGDGAFISQGTFVSREGLWPFYVSLRSGRGSIWSWLTFETNEVTFGTNVFRSDVAGEARWFTPTLSTARYYLGGFTNALDAVGSRHVPPSSTNGSLTFSNGVVTFSGGNLPAPFTNNVFRAANDRVTDQGTNRLSLKINRSSGLMSGSVVVPDTGRKVSFKGALFQNGDFGFGHFLHTNASGAVLLAPRE